MESTKALEQTVVSKLAALAKEPSHAFLTTGPLKPAERLLSIDRGPSSLTIHLASEGLKLDDKALLERELLSAISGVSEPAAKVIVNFRRRNPLANPAKGAAEPSAPQSAPYGLKINKKPIPGVSRVILVASGKGGVGKSTVSVNLAVALAQQGQRVGLLDADIYGPSAPTMLGLQGPLGVTAGQRIVPLERFDVKTVSFGFLSDIYNPVIARGPVISKGLRQLVYETEWGELDYLVIDMPPGTGDVQLTLMEDLPIAGAVIVSTPQNVALLDAHKALTMFQKLKVPVLGLVENMAFHTCSACGHEDEIFGDGADDFARERGTRVLARIPLRAALRESGDSGIPMALRHGELSKPFQNLAAIVLENGQNEHSDHM